jgi:hypothetical protein
MNQFEQLTTTAVEAGSLTAHPLEYSRLQGDETPEEPREMPRGCGRQQRGVSEEQPHGTASHFARIGRSRHDPSRSLHHR